MSLEDFVTKLKTGCCPNEQVTFSWSKRGVGFGEFSFYEKDGKLYCDNEKMSKKFIKEMICDMVDDCIMTDPSQWD